MFFVFATLDRSTYIGKSKFNFDVSTRLKGREVESPMTPFSKPPIQIWTRKLNLPSVKQTNEQMVSIVL